MNDPLADATLVGDSRLPRALLGIEREPMEDRSETREEEEQEREDAPGRKPVQKDRKRKSPDQDAQNRDPGST
jgi:hypothetical protein